MSKKKGTRAERELLHMFWNNKFGVIRSAGSGSTTLPNPDILVGKNRRYLAIECKSLNKGSKFFPKEEISQLDKFSRRFNAEPWLAIRFDREGWYFIQPKYLTKSENGNLTVSLRKLKESNKSVRFEELCKEISDSK